MQLASRETSDHRHSLVVLCWLDNGGGGNVTRARAVDDINDLWLSVRGHLEAGGTWINSSIENGDNCVASVIIGVLFQVGGSLGFLKSQGGGYKSRTDESVMVHVAIKTLGLLAESAYLLGKNALQRKLRNRSDVLERGHFVFGYEQERTSWGMYRI